jgi:multiple sugar transport system permease protein
LKPILAITLLIRATDSLRTFDLIYVMTSGGPGVSTEVYNFYVYMTGFRYFRIGRASSLAFVLTIIIMIIVIPLFRKIFVRMMGMKK